MTTELATEAPLDATDQNSMSIHYAYGLTALERQRGQYAVSYTHLTLPTKRIV